MKAIIVGGGIGGLTTALMLRARGIGCELFEQSDSIRELGVGINTLPHAIKELAELGLLDRLDDVAIRTYPNGDKIPEAFYRKGLALSTLKDVAGARTAWEEVVMKYPQSQEADLARQGLERLKRP